MFQLFSLKMQNTWSGIADCHLLHFHDMSSVQSILWWSDW